MIARSLIIASALAAALAWGFWHRSAAGVAQDKLAASEARVLGLERAGAELNNHLRRIRSERDHWQAVAADLEEREGINDPLSDYLRSVLDRVQRPRRAGHSAGSYGARAGYLRPRRNGARARELRYRPARRPKRGEQPA